MGNTATDPPTPNGYTDSDHDGNKDEYVITVTLNTNTQGKVTLTGIASGSTNFDNLNVIPRAADSTDYTG